MSKHQNVRIAMLSILTPLLIVPMIIMVFAGIMVFILPLIPFLITKTFLLFAFCYWTLMFVQSMFFGRAYCSHICPITGIFAIVSHLSKNREILSSHYPKVIEPIFNVLWIIAPLYVILRLLGNVLNFLPFEQVYLEPLVILISLLYLGSFILSKSIGKSDVPHYICPFSPFIKTGIKIGKKIKLPTISLVSYADKCKSCKKCIPSTKCLMNYDVATLVKDQKLNFNECLNCGSCAEFCVHKAIEYKI